MTEMALIILLFLHLISTVYSQYKTPTLSVHYDHTYDELILVCEIPTTESVPADYSCNLYTGHLQLLNVTSKTRKDGVLFCIFTVTRNYLISRLQSERTHEVSCDYSLKSDPLISSPMSEKHNVRKWLPGLTQLPTTKKSTTASPLSTTSLITRGPTTTASTQDDHRLHHTSADPSENYRFSTTPSAVSNLHTETTVFTGSTVSTWIFIVMSITGGSVLLAGVVLYLRCFIRKRRTKRLDKTSTSGNQGDMMAMLSVEECSPGTGTYSQITAVPIPQLYSESVLAVHSDDSGPSALTYSEITAVPPTLQSFESGIVLGETCKTTEEDVHHAYCTIQDKLVSSKQNDVVYNLLQKH